MTSTLARRSLAALALLAVIGAGCSRAPAGTGTSGGTNTATNREQALKFAVCMRESGVREFPDPDASGNLTVDQVANGSSLDTSTPAFTQALSVCKDLEPPGFTGAERSPEQQQAALEFARCIRGNGVPDFPDPARGEPLVDTNRIPSANRTGGMSRLNAAMRTCGAIYAGQLGLKGQ